MEKRLFPFLLFKTLGEFWAALPILVPLYLSCGLKASEVFLVQGAFALTVLILEIPSGYLADRYGRKRSLLGSALFLPSGVLLYLRGWGLGAFALSESVIGIGQSLRSGSDSALLYDTLKEEGREGEYTRWEGRAFFCARMGVLVSALLGGYLGTVSLRLPLVVNLVVFLLLIPLALLLREPSGERRVRSKPWKDLGAVCKQALKRPELRRGMLRISLTNACQLTSLWASFLAYRVWRVPLPLFGFLFALFQLASALGAAGAHSFARKVRHFLFLPGLFWIALGLSFRPLLLPLILCAAFFWGLATPVLLDDVNRRVESSVRATLISLSSMGGSLLFVLVSPLFGLLADHLSLGASYLFLGFVFSLGTLLLGPGGERAVKRGGGGKTPSSQGRGTSLERPVEKVVTTPGGVCLWTESFGSLSGRPLLLIMGAMNQGLFWPEEFCRGLASRGFLVIRYDHRDTGGSTVLDYSKAPYSLEELTEDALSVLDGYGLERANMMGLSMGGYVAQILAARSPERVEKLILLSTTADHRPYMAATTGSKGERGLLPPPTEGFLSYLKVLAESPPQTVEEEEAVILKGWRVTHGGSLPFREESMLALIRKSRERCRDVSAPLHHASAVLASPPRMDLLEKIVAPTLILHGLYDPCLPVEHGRYLEKGIKNARLVVLDMGHAFLPEMSSPLGERVERFLGEGRA